MGIPMNLRDRLDEVEVIDCSRIPQGSLDYMLHIVSRIEWGARDNKGQHVLRHPIKLVIDHFTYSPPCYTQEQCISAVRELQDKDLAGLTRDIKYNFLIGGDGYIYEGRGWQLTASKALTKVPFLFRRRLDIAYIGDFTETKIPEVMQRRKMDLIFFGIRFRKIYKFLTTMSFRDGDYLDSIGKGHLERERKMEEDRYIKKLENIKNSSITSDEEKKLIEEDVHLIKQGKIYGLFNRK